MPGISNVIYSSFGVARAHLWNIVFATRHQQLRIKTANESPSVWELGYYGSPTTLFISHKIPMQPHPTVTQID